MTQSLITPIQGELSRDHTLSRERVEQIQSALLDLPQADVARTDHYFQGGMYCRRMWIPQGVLIAGKIHKTDHLFIGCQGELVIWGEGPRYLLKPGDIRKSPKGTKRIVYSLSDCVVLTLHKSEEKPLDELEKDMVEDDPDSAFDMNNRLKPGFLEDREARRLVCLTG